MTEFKLFSIGLRIRRRAILRSGWQMLGVAGAFFGLLTALMYGFVLAYALNNASQFSAALPENIRELLFSLIAGSSALLFVMRNVVPSLKEKISVIPALAPVSSLRRTVAQLVMDITTPLFLMLFAFIAAFTLRLEVLHLHEAIYLWSSFFIFWIFSHALLTLIHHTLETKLLYAPAVLFALPFLLSGRDDESAVASSLFLAGTLISSFIYFWLLEHYSRPRHHANSGVRSSDVNKMLGRLSLKEKKMRMLMLVAAFGKLVLALYLYLIQDSNSGGTDVLKSVYIAFLLSPVAVANYFLANLWGLNSALWLRLNAGGADIRSWFSVFWKVSKIPFIAEFLIGLALYTALIHPVSVFVIALALLSFPLLLVSAFLASLWLPKKIDRAMSFTQGNSVAFSSSLIVLITVFLVFMIQVHPLFAIGPALLASIQLQVWKRTHHKYLQKSPTIFQKLKK